MENALEAIEVEALDAAIKYATDNEATLLADADALIKTGEHNAASAIAGAFKAKIPLLGGTIGGAFVSELDSLEPKAEIAVKAGFDKALTFLKDLRAKIAA